MGAENKKDLLDQSVSRRGFVGAAAVAGIGLAGCSSSSDDSGSSSGSSSTEEAASNSASLSGEVIVEPTNTDGVSDDNDLVIAIEGNITELHPMNWSDGNSGNIVNAMYDPLIKLDENMELQPCLATEWEVSDDALTYTFYLRDDVVFTDGSSFDSSVVLANYEYTTDADRGLRRRRIFVQTNDDESETWRVSDVSAPDDYTVVFTLADPWSPFLTRMAQFEIISPDCIATDEADGSIDYNSASYGSGPFMLQEWSSGDHTTVVPNPDYWGEAPTVDSVTVREVPESGSRISMLETGEADFVYPTPSDQISTLESAGDIYMVAQKSNIMRYVTLNNDVEPLGDVTVRQAMNYAIDKDSYVSVLYSGYADIATSVLPESIASYKEHDIYEYDTDKAKEMLEEAGYGDGFEIDLWCDNTTQETKAGEFIQQQLAEVGITVNVEPMEPATISEMAAYEEDETEIELWYVNWSQNDADGYMRSLLQSGNIPPTAYNTAFWKNDEFDEALEKGNAAAEQEEQDEYYGEAQDIAWEECPWLFLASDNLLYSYKSYVSGIVMCPDATIDFSKAALAQ